MNKSLSSIAIVVFGIFSLNFIAPDYFEWSTEKKLSFNDFKGSAPSGNGTAVNLSTLITYQSSQAAGSTPKMTILNYVDRNNSWIKVKKQEVLDIQQMKFDYSELTVRKIRKEMENLSKKGVKDKQKYIDAISKISNDAKKRNNSKFVMLEDQPHLIKIMKKDVMDSLNLYKNYKK